MSERYIPTEAECRCLTCGDMLAVPALWLDTVPPDRRCPEGAKIVTDCVAAMENAKAKAWLIKLLAEAA